MGKSTVNKTPESALLEAKSRHFEINMILNFYSKVEQRHPYLMQHRIAPNNARQMGDYLIVGVERLTPLGMMWSNVLQIDITGRQSFEYDEPTLGAFIRIGSVDHATRVYVCEDYPTACTIHQLTQGSSVFCALSQDNMLAVAQAVREAHPASPMTVVATNDSNIEDSPSIETANAVAQEVGAYVTSPLELGSYNDDVCRRASLLGQATPPEQVVVSVRAERAEA
jgi:phage/plasmid primase-like uncharacterized protein